MRVLVVDDNAINRKLLRVTLVPAGHEVVEAADGIEALKTLRSGGFDAIISDVLMPGMDGYRLCYEVRRTEELKGIPFIIYTSTYTSPSDERLALSVGADKFLTKPSPAEAILGALESAKNAASLRREPGPPLGELEVLKEYSEALVRKLEHKNQELEASERRYREIVSLAPIGIYRTTREGRFASVNAAFVRALGYEAVEEVLSLDLLRDVYFDSADRERAIAENERRGGESAFELRFKRRDGTPFWVRVHARAVRGESGAIGHYEGFVYDIDESKQAEKEMRRSEERFRRLFDSNTIGIAIADLAGGILETNAAYLNMLGYTREELLAGEFRWDTLTPPEHRARDQIAVQQLQATGVAQPWEKELLRKDGSRVPVLIGVAMLEASEASCIAYIVDLSALKRLEDQFRQAQKMEAVGQLAGGIAHDFNNLLTAILGYSDLLLTEVGEGSALEESIGEIRKAGERAASLTRQLLAFSRRQVLEPKVLDVNALVENLEKMLRRLIGEDVELVTDLAPHIGRVQADAGQIEQVIMNLVVNARDAMPKGGTLRIETRNAELDEGYSGEHGVVGPAGSYVMFAVSDTGAGMSAETKAHLFEPFFTTKGLGKGTGLGLATVYGIVKQSGGYVWVYSEIGHGTVFKVYLPRLEAAETDVPSPAQPRAEGGSETLLLVEDDPSVRNLTRRILERLGYSVIEANASGQALDAVRRHKGKIHLLLTDVVMPEMGGAELASQISRLHPDTKVLFMSGYTDDAVIRNGLIAHGGHFLQKPFTPDALARKVRELLDQEP
jgi:two-component system cell cycle sensor histidine kinase/response regulator CckA